MIALSLPQTDEMPIREKLFTEISTADLKSDEGLSTLLEFLDQNLGKDDLIDSLDKFEDFNKFQRKERMPIQEYICAFDTNYMYKEIEKKGVKYSSAILAFQLVKKANISRKEKALVFAGVTFKNTATIYEDVRKSLNIVKGDSVLSSDSSLEQERAFIGVDKEYFHANYSKPRKNGHQNFGGALGESKHGWSRRGHKGAGANQQTESSMNKTGIKKKINLLHYWTKRSDTNM